MDSYYEEKKLTKRLRTDRYRNCKQLIPKESGDSLLSTREIEKIPFSPSDLFFTVTIREVGRLDLISYDYYQTPLLWWVIAQANNIYNPIDDFSVGTLLRIPALETLYGYRGILL